MATPPKIQYRVKKVTISNVQCPVCKGVGSREIKSINIWKTVKCQHCINGVTTIEHMTEIDLKQALNEMGIYRMIQNTVKDILNPPQSEIPFNNQQQQQS